MAAENNTRHRTGGDGGRRAGGGADHGNVQRARGSDNLHKPK